MFIAEWALPDPRRTTSRRCGPGSWPATRAPSRSCELVDAGIDEITIGYGQTEASPVITQTRMDDDSTSGSAPSAARPGVEVKIVDPVTDEMPPGEAGELATSGHKVMLATRTSRRRPPRRSTRRLAAHRRPRRDGEDGNYRITGRIKDMVIRGGENIYPARSRSSSTRIPRSRTSRWSAPRPEVRRGTVRLGPHPSRRRHRRPEAVREFAPASWRTTRSRTTSGS